SGNTSASHGGAIAVLGGGLRVVASDLFDNRSGAFGAAVLVGSASTAVIERSSVRDNSGVPAISPVAAVMVESGGTLALLGTTVAQNSAGVAADGAELLFVINSTIADNLGSGLEATFAAGNRLAFGASVVSGNGALGASTRDCVFTSLALADVLFNGYVLSNDD